MRVFIDTNLWVYRLDRRDERRREAVAVWLREVGERDDIVVSTQVLVELRSALTRKLTPPLPQADVRRALDALTAFDVIPTDAALVLDAHELAAAEKLAWFDALIVEAAIRSGCARLYSEDLQDGRRFGPLVVENPLR